MRRPAVPLAVTVVVATLPYLTLKLLWLGGSTVGVTDPAFLAAPGIVAGNAVTAALDAVAVVLAVALARDRLRPPAVVVLATGWVGSGFLLLVAVSTPLAVLIALAGGGPVLAGPEPLATWVRPLVYGGFTLQGVGLVGLLAGHAIGRWPAASARTRTGSTPLARTLVLGAAPLLLVAAAHESAAAVGAAGPWTAEGALVAGLRAGALVAAVVGGVRVTRGGGTAAVVAAWAGTGTAVAWGLYALVTTLAGTVFAGPPDPVGHLADLAQTLGGLVTALAVLGVLTARVAADPDRAQDVGGSSTSASKQVRSPV